MQFTFPGDLSAFLVAMFQEVNMAMQRIFNVLARPTYVEAATSRVKVAIESAGVTVTGLTSLSQLGGFDVKMGVTNSLERNLWYSSVRRCIT